MAVAPNRIDTLSYLVAHQAQTGAQNLWNAISGTLVERESWTIATTTARCVQYLCVPWKMSTVLSVPTATFPEICNGLLFRSILRMCVQNLFVALPVLEIIRGTEKISAVPGRPTPTLLFPKIFNGLLFGWTLAVNVSAKFEVRSFTRSWDNGQYSKNLGSTWIRPRSLSSRIFKGFLFSWTLWMPWPNLKFVSLPVPEIIGRGRPSPKISAVPGYAHAPLSRKFLMGVC